MLQIMAAGSMQVLLCQQAAAAQCVRPSSSGSTYANHLAADQGSCFTCSRNLAYKRTAEHRQCKQTQRARVPVALHCRASVCVISHAATTTVQRPLPIFTWLACLDKTCLRKELATRSRVYKSFESDTVFWHASHGSNDPGNISEPTHCCPGTTTR
jgi:hypothetical protein